MDFIEHPWINVKTIQKRRFQEKIAAKAVTANTLVVVPTGLGKTSIAALVAADRLQKNMKMKILFVAPTKPLVEQHRKSFAHFLKVGESELQIVTGSNNPEDRKRLYEKADIIFSTPQTIRNDLKKSRLALNNFSLLIVDEAHRAVGNYAYPYVANIFMKQSKDPLILALTASPGAQRYKIKEVRDKLFIKNVEIRTRDDEDVKPYIQKVDYHIEEVELSQNIKIIKEYLEKVKEDRIQKLIKWGILHSQRVTKTQILKMQQHLARKKSGSSFAAMSLLAEVLKVDHALLTLETQCLYSLKNYFEKLMEQKTKASSRLFEDENFIIAQKLTEERIKNGDEHPKIEKIKELVSTEFEANKMTGIIIFAQLRDTIEKILDVVKDIKHASPVAFIGQTKKKGKGLSQKEQVQILNEFKMGFYNILVASQVGEEGLDIEETDVVIFYEPVPSAIRRVQRTGRTARTHPGKVIVMMTKSTRDEAFHWSAHHKENKMKEVLYEMQKGQTSVDSFGDEKDKKD